MRNNDLFPDVMWWKPELHEDNRGFSYEPYRKLNLHYLGIPECFPQELCSFSHRKVLRGLHYGTQGLGRLIHVVSGIIFDVFVDLRKNSPTFGNYSSEMLPPGYMIYIPEYFAHGFIAIEPSTIVYHFTKPYSEENHRILAYNDPTMGIDWIYHDVIVSERDKNGTLLKDLDFYF